MRILRYLINTSLVLSLSFSGVRAQEDETVQHPFEFIDPSTIRRFDNSGILDSDILDSDILDSNILGYGSFRIHVDHQELIQVIQVIQANQHPVEHRYEEPCNRSEIFYMLEPSVENVVYKKLVEALAAAIEHNCTTVIRYDCDYRIKAIRTYPQETQFSIAPELKEWLEVVDTSNVADFGNAMNSLREQRVVIKAFMGDYCKISKLTTRFYEPSKNIAALKAALTKDSSQESSWSLEEYIQKLQTIRASTVGPHCTQFGRQEVEQENASLRVLGVASVPITDLLSHTSPISGLIHKAITLNWNSAEALLSKKLKERNTIAREFVTKVSELQSSAITPEQREAQEEKILEWIQANRPYFQSLIDDEVILDTDGNQLLHYAASFSEILIRGLVNPYLEYDLRKLANCKNQQGKTPLMIIVSNGWIRLFKPFFINKLNSEWLKWEDNKGRTVLDCACATLYNPFRKTKKIVNFIDTDTSQKNVLKVTWPNNLCSHVFSAPHLKIQEVLILRGAKKTRAYFINLVSRWTIICFLAGVGGVVGEVVGGVVAPWLYKLWYYFVHDQKDQVKKSTEQDPASSAPAPTKTQ